MKQPSRPRIFLLGDINLDTTLYMLLSQNLVRMRSSNGWGARPVGISNTAVVLSRLGAVPTLLACCGCDAETTSALEDLTNNGVDVSQVKRNSQRGTGNIFIAVSQDGERTMYSYRGANRLYRPGDIPERELSTASFLHLSGYAILEAPQRDAFWKAVHLAKQANVPISLDFCPPAVQNRPDVVEELVSAVSICVLDFEQASDIARTQDLAIMASHFMKLGCKTLAIKMGRRGCFLAREGESGEFPVFPVESVDTTGAGDAFSAGMMLAFLWELSLPATAALSNGLGALASSVYGAGVHFPSYSMILDFLKKNENYSPYQQILPDLLHVIETFVGSPNGN